MKLDCEKNVFFSYSDSDRFVTTVSGAWDVKDTNVSNAKSWYTNVVTSSFIFSVPRFSLSNNNSISPHSLAQPRPAARLNSKHSNNNNNNNCSNSSRSMEVVAAGLYRHRPRPTPYRTRVRPQWRTIIIITNSSSIISNSLSSKILNKHKNKRVNNK